MPGPGKKPGSLKNLSGTVQKCRAVIDIVKLPLIEDTPPPPDWLPNSHAVKEWQRLAPILTNNKLLTEAGLSGFGMLCALHGKIVQLYAAGECPNGNMMGQLRGLLNDYGLTPVAQGKVKPSGETEKTNKFANNIKRA